MSNKETQETNDHLAYDTPFGVMQRHSSPCRYCGAPVLWYDSDYDAAFCLQCNTWLESACDDPDCWYCPGRPERPCDGDRAALIDIHQFPRL